MNTLNNIKAALHKQKLKSLPKEELVTSCLVQLMNLIRSYRKKSITFVLGNASYPTGTYTEWHVEVVRKDHKLRPKGRRSDGGGPLLSVLLPSHFVV